MKLTLRAGGNIRSGPERDMIDDYMKRASGLARSQGFHSVIEQQIDLKSCKNRTQETEKLLSSIPSHAKLILMDERGKSLTSRKLAQNISNLRNDGFSELYLVIGGADGFDPALIPPGTQKWAFGVQTWPHKLLRVMLTEQIYRALTILAGTPYHRD